MIAIHGVGFHQCHNKAKFKVGPHMWCGVHHPTRQLRRQIERDAKWNAEWEEKRRKSAHREKLNDLVNEIVKTARLCFKQEASFDDLEQLVHEYERLEAGEQNG